MCDGLVQPLGEMGDKVTGSVLRAGSREQERQRCVGKQKQREGDLNPGLLSAWRNVLCWPRCRGGSRRCAEQSGRERCAEQS